MKSKTLTDLIVIAIFVTLGVMLASSFRDAKAQDGNAMTKHLVAADVNFIYSVRNAKGTLYVFDSGTKSWTDAKEACQELVTVDNRLHKVVISNGSEANTTSEIRWDADRKTLTNLDGRNEAICN